MPQSRSWSDLPEDAWARILGFLPASTRLEDAALVCSKLNRAAAAATQQVVLGAAYPLAAPLTGPESFGRWLATHGRQHITALDSPWTLELQLPLHWPNLQSLKLHSCTPQMLAGLLPSCPQLTALHLGTSAVSNQAFDSLAEATGLRRLRLDRPVGRAGAATFLPGTVLQRLTGLTQLRFDLAAERAGGQPTLQHISCLLSLQDLEVRSDTTSLVLSPARTPGLSALTGLTRLCVFQGTLDPSVLSAATQLRFLDLQRVVLELRPEPGRTEAARALFSCVERMLRLQHLVLELSLLEWPAEAWPYSALTASSELTALRLSASGTGSEPAAGMWSAMLVGGAYLPALQELQSVLEAPFIQDHHHHDDGSDSDDEDDAIDIIDITAHADRLPRSALSACEVGRLAGCCRGLRECELRVCDDVQLSPLTALRQLTKLSLHAPSEATFRSLTALTRLKHLQCEECGDICPSVLVGLTALRGLEVLVLSPNELLVDGGGPFDVYINTQVEEAEDRLPVWAQLQQHCAGHRRCHALLLQGLFQTVQEQQRAAAQEQQAHRQQQEMLNAQVVQLQQQVEGKRRKLSAARSEAAELRGRVTALEGQPGTSPAGPSAAAAVVAAAEGVVLRPGWPLPGEMFAMAAVVAGGAAARWRAGQWPL